VANEYQQFYEYWSDISASPKFLNKFPYKLSLGVDSDGAPLLPFRSSRTLGNQILVIEAYDKIFDRLMVLRKKDKGTTRGAVLTGQSGTGASL